MNMPTRRTFISKTNDGKQILREMMSTYIPTEITKGKNKGFHRQTPVGLRAKVLTLWSRKSRIIMRNLLVSRCFNGAGNFGKTLFRGSE